MNRILIKSIIPYILLAGILFSACKKEEQPIAPVIIPQASVVNLFVWNGLHDYYLWNSQVPGLANTKYEKTDSLNAFLNKYSDPEKLFNSLLYKRDTVDKWSFIVDDSKQIDDWISGISETIGYTVVPVRIGNSQDLFGLVLYVFKGSPAEKAGIKRGDVFLKVNDQQINVSNYQTLLYNTITSKLSFATLSNHQVVPSDRTATVTAIQMQENPINKDTVFTVNNQKVGYLVYNGFNSDFDLQLNDVIQKFKDANINQMILDLRYNGGGSVQSSIYLASMLYGTDKTKLFAKAQYNEGVQQYLVDAYGLQSLNDNFTNTIEATTTHAATAINTLNLQKIYIIVSDNTASASELLINGLKPYMNVKVVGVNTTGKYVGSISLKDENENGVVNPNNKWAMQPIVVKYANSLGVSDFVNGLTPDIRAEEDIANLLPFGDPNETLLSVVLNDIKGLSPISMTLKSAEMGLKKVADPHANNRFAKDMYINPDKFKGLTKGLQ
ncbi:MAG TPA: S41 family peptidase [Prolixibacteraceae bacterium]|jgi:C-terminal processing protease CtpA/Prc